MHVAGAVRRPGLFRVPGARAWPRRSSARAGRARRAELAAVNLAAPLEDGQQVVVPGRGAGARRGTGAPGAGSRGAAGRQLSLATATVDQLDALDGIGPTLAERIVEYRDATAASARWSSCARSRGSARSGSRR